MRKNRAWYFAALMICNAQGNECSEVVELHGGDLVTQEQEHAPQLERGCKQFCHLTAEYLQVNNAASITNLCGTNATFRNLNATNGNFANLNVSNLLIFPATFGHAAVIDNSQIVAPNADVIFTNTFLLTSSNVSVTPLTSSTFTTITVPPGAYAFFFSVDGTDTTTLNAPIFFGLFNQTLGVPVPASEFHSLQVSGTVTTQNGIARGFGIAIFATPTSLSLRNFSSTDTAQLTSYNDGGVSASMGFILIGKPS